MPPEAAGRGQHFHVRGHSFSPYGPTLKAMLHEAIFLATCNAMMTNKKPLKLQRGCYTQATSLTTLRKVEGRSTLVVSRYPAAGKCFQNTPYPAV